MSDGKTNQMTHEMKEVPMTIKLTALEREALDECLTTYMSDAEGLNYTNGNPIIMRSRKELELDLSTVAKRKLATYIAATLEAMTDPDMNSGWSSPRRREACTRLASKIDPAVGVANGVEVTVSEEVQSPCVAQGRHPRTELVPGKRYLLPGANSDAHVVLIYKECDDEVYTFANATGEGECTYAAEDLTELVALADDAGQALAVPDRQLVPAKEPEDHHLATPEAPVPSTPDEGHHLITPVASDEVMTSENIPVTGDAPTPTTSVPTPPDTDDEVTTADMIREVEEYITDYIKLDPVYTLPLALFITFTHCWHECFPVAPQVIVTAATSQSGKSALIELMSFASARPWLYSKVTPAALYRIITGKHPTIYMDEAERLNSEKSEYREVLNGGYRDGQTVHLVVGNQLVDFHNFCPKVFGLIGDLYDTLRDRSIMVVLSRRMGKAPKRRYNYFLAKERGEELASRLNKLIAPMFKRIKTAYGKSAQQDSFLSFLSDRDREIWEPLFVLCGLLCPERVQELEHCAAVIAANKTHDLRRISAVAEREADDAGASESALRDIGLVMRGHHNMATAELIPALRALPTGGWGNYRRPGGITNDRAGEMLLSSLLSRFGVTPGTIRVAPKDTPQSTLQGYKTADVVAAMAQYGIEPHESSPDHPVTLEPAVSDAVRSSDALRTSPPSASGWDCAPDEADIAEPTTTNSDSACKSEVEPDKTVASETSNTDDVVKAVAKPDIAVPDVPAVTISSSPDRGTLQVAVADPANVPTPPMTETAQITATIAATPRPKAYVKVHRVYVKTKTHFRVRVPSGYLNYEFLTMTEDSDPVDSIWVGDIIAVERVKPIDERGLRNHRVRKLPGATHSPVTPKPTAKPDKPINEPRTSHCYAIRLANREEDLIDIGLTAQEAATIKVQDLTFRFVGKSETSMCKRIVQFIKRHEWLGTMPLHPTHRFVAEHKGQLAGVVILSMPTAFSKLLGDNTKDLERLISRGACVSWSPKNTASAMLAFAMEWMAKNTPNRLFVCYADEEAQEIGQIYQSLNAIYLGQFSGTQKMYFDPKRPERGYFSDRCFRSRAAWKRYARTLGIEWQHEWQSGEKIYWGTIPEDIATKLREFSKSEQTRCQYRAVAPKHKYLLIRGRDRRETKALMRTFRQLNPKLVGLPYPKRRWNSLQEDTETVTPTIVA